MALLQDRITKKEMEFFFKQLLILQDFQNWRKTELDFVDMDSKITKERLDNLKSDINFLYPSFGKKFFERVTGELGMDFKYKDASIHIFKLYKDKQFQGLSLI